MIIYPSFLGLEQKEGFFLNTKYWWGDIKSKSILKHKLYIKRQLYIKYKFEGGRVLGWA